jgi:hypothetical protein
MTAPRHWGSDDLLHALARWGSSTADHRIAAYTAAARGDQRLPSPELAINRFGSWRSALIAAGVQGDGLRRRWSAADITTTLAGWLAKEPSGSSHQYRRDAVMDPALPTLGTVVARFGSWTAAVAAARAPSSSATSR